MYYPHVLRPQVGKASCPNLLTQRCASAAASHGNGKVSCYRKAFGNAMPCKKFLSIKKERAEGRRKERDGKAKLKKKKIMQQVAVLISLLLAISPEWKKFKKQRISLAS